ncbi:unnamed protein product [Rotaria sp. Silwood2]|nr:unnamed protein product [Rotaria sp. Silwood2]
MASSHPSAPKSESGERQTPVVKKHESSASSSSSSASAVARHKSADAPTPNKPTLSKPAAKPTSAQDSPPSKVEKLPVVPARISPQATNNQPQSSESVSVVSTDENINTSDKDQNEIQEVKVMSSEEKPKIDICPICLDDCTEPKRLDKCGHTFCVACIDQYFQTIKPQCPCCFTIYGEIRGNQPEDGFMVHTVLRRRLPGFKHTSSGTIEITYHFPNGTQDKRHPNPGMPYHGTTRVAYLPDNNEGRNILKLLEKAFHLRQIFTVGQSRTTGYDNVVTWNDIHHKTNFYGGMQQ